MSDDKKSTHPCMFSGFKQEKLYVQRTLKTFQRLVGLEMKNPQPHGGRTKPVEWRK